MLAAARLRRRRNWLVATALIGGGIGLTAGCDGRERKGPPSQGVPYDGGQGGDSFTPLPASSSSGSGGEENVLPDPQAPCDADLALDDADPFNAARAIGLCKQAADANDWGVVDARWRRVDGSDPPATTEYALGRGLLEGFGAEIDVLEGQRMLALSSGTAREPGQPGYNSPEGFDKGYFSTHPPGFPKESPACPGVTTGEAHDDIALEVVVRAPVDAQSFAFNFNFYTYEWPDFICSPFNDFFVALLDPPPMDFPDGNISFDQEGNPVSVNNALVRVCNCIFGPPCQAPPSDPQITYECPEKDDELAGTGFVAHAATGWLVTSSPIAAGDEVRIRFGVYDSGDGVLDSTTLIDGFRWLGDPQGRPETKPEVPK
jgi:hypothetical protein